MWSGRTREESRRARSTEGVFVKILFQTQGKASLPKLYTSSQALLLTLDRCVTSA